MAGWQSPPPSAEILGPPPHLSRNDSRPVLTAAAILAPARPAAAATSDRRRRYRAGRTRATASSSREPPDGKRSTAAEGRGHVEYPCAPQSIQDGASMVTDNSSRSAASKSACIAASGMGEQSSGTTSLVKSFLGLHLTVRLRRTTKQRWQ